MKNKLYLNQEGIMNIQIISAIIVAGAAIFGAVFGGWAVWYVSLRAENNRRKEMSDFFKRAIQEDLKTPYSFMRKYRMIGIEVILYGLSLQLS
jgi:hypothetical protein